MQNIIDKILNFELVEKILNSEQLSDVLNYIYNLSSTEITVLIIITVVLTLCIAYRWFGVYVLAGLFLIYLFVYILYEVDVLNIYHDRESAINRQEQLLEFEMMKQ